MVSDFCELSIDKRSCARSSDVPRADTAGHNFDDAGPYIIGIGNYRK
jgi:hypothetical protein